MITCRPRSARAVVAFLAAASLVMGLSLTDAAAQTKRTVTVNERVKPTIWIDPDGCMHWIADGGWEGYMADRVNPETGMPVCLDVNTCAVENSDQLFATDSARIHPAEKRRLARFFRQADAFAYAIYGHTDSRASDEYNMRLSERRAASVAKVARSVGARVAREIGYGERRPVATNATAAGMQKNRRVEIVCYR